jgi:hypothetical protein
MVTAKVKREKARRKFPRKGRAAPRGRVNLADFAAAVAVGDVRESATEENEAASVETVEANASNAIAT